MTDRFNAFIVTLDRDIREDDAENLKAAILQLRGVAHVEGNVANIEDHIAESRVRATMMRKLIELFSEENRK